MAQQLNTVLHQLFGKSRTWQVILLQQWTTIIGNLHAKVTIEKIYKDTIVLGVSNSCWLQELYLLSPILLQRINQTLDQPHIKKIRFKKQSISKKKAKKRSQQTKKRDQCYLLSSKEEAVLQSIKNVELRTVLKNFLIRCYRERGSEAEPNMASHSMYHCK